MHFYDLVLYMFRQICCQVDLFSLCAKSLGARTVPELKSTTLRPSFTTIVARARRRWQYLTRDPEYRVIYVLLEMVLLVMIISAPTETMKTTQKFGLNR
ncbi:hypothetical protein PVAP13_9NG174900 [Panicum virgatum]|uniref:Uncharacterized protein n=1 Tax=Panicum virgatum TaxID=38727 RepID=A0A8T0MFV9_PANVG|nr:hypothetical protein PVAP13_9NG174900 [Panicum virgatum]